ncbi:type II toxin-antitoxin system RelE/ParE family toxin [Comamonas thiooxydans]|uniref:type II toxin-antitoxin system RelE/ParE family toxin n=1 Tax=Comamonas thiooxydans TaxID=363952 RepID=UPI001CCA7D76|nr:type II toxin-antitoxin system RelE/ParE family toxin [Comamonas thiooxydans]UBQ43423.1 type II toxin-antitoxin system RelE/ParE family toxin [Comamonas thiooxydans]
MQQSHVELTPKFKKFLANLNDSLAKTKILARLKRLQFQGNWGDKASVGDGVIELRIDHGPGYRVYCKQIGGAVVIILGGGTKNGQQADIDAAKADAKAL